MSESRIFIAPSLLSADFTRLGDQIRAVEDAGADILHVDIMDGRFVPNITMGPFIVEAIRRVASIPLDVHLMIVEPQQYLADFASAGADWLSVHLEASPHLHRTLQAIRQLECRVGVAINPHTPAHFLVEVLSELDFVNVMTVNPGFSGQPFIPQALTKIRQLKEMAATQGRSLDIEVDGGINEVTMGAVVAAGANVCVAGSSVFGNQRGIKDSIAGLRAVIAEQ